MDRFYHSYHVQVVLTDMEFVCQYNAWISERAKRSLREKHGYIKRRNIAGTGKPGYVRSIAMTAKNVEEIRQRGEHQQCTGLHSVREIPFFPADGADAQQGALGRVGRASWLRA